MLDIPTVSGMFVHSLKVGVMHWVHWSNFPNPKPTRGEAETPTAQGFQDSTIASKKGCNIAH